jgi:hypothetical protein
MDAPGWQTLERKQRFITQALRGDASIRRLDDMDGEANQYAMAKALASGDERLLKKAGLEADVARLRRLKAEFFNRRVEASLSEKSYRERANFARKKAEQLAGDILRRVPTAGDAFSMVVNGDTFTKRKDAGYALIATWATLDQTKFRGDKTIGQIGGFPVVYEGWGSDKRYENALGVEFTPGVKKVNLSSDPVGMVTTLERALAKIEEDQLDAAASAERFERSAATAADMLTRKFEYEAELDHAIATLQEIDDSLAASPNGLDAPANENSPTDEAKPQPTAA